MTNKVKVAIPLIPHKPGCYLMKDKDDKVIYVGKAKDLYNRVSQYFLRPQIGKVNKMQSSVDHFDYIITKTEKEAFILEMNLIHQYYPRYNILLKDGKHYPYIALKKKGDPYLKISHNDKDNKYYYFGPYPTSGYAYKVINLLNKVFPTRKCRTLQTSTCLYFHMGQCLAPCVNKIDESKYEDLVSQIKSFLEGNTDDIVSSLKKKLDEYTENMEYEKAKDTYETITSIKEVVSTQVVETKDHISRDVFSYSIRDGYISLAVLTYRRGILLGKECFINELFDDENEQVLNLIMQYYSSHSLPKEIVANIPNISSLEDILNIKVSSPSRGKLLEIINIASLNAKQELDSHFMSARLEDDNLKLLEDLGNKLNIKTPLHIELFDNSHINGASPVGVAVVFINGKPLKKLYRTYNIEGEIKNDDYSSMKEVMTRRYKRMIEEENELPDLIITDGGLGQVHAGVEVMENLKLNIPVFGLFKNDHHQTKGLISKDGDVISLDDNKPLFFLLVRMQDEVHRFAISFHHKKRSKAFTSSILDDIPGLGSKRKELIRSRYLSIDELKNASVDELSQLIPMEIAIKVIEKVNK